LTWPRKYLDTTTFVAVTLQLLGTSTLFCSNTMFPEASPIEASRFSQVVVSQTLAPTGQNDCVHVRPDSASMLTACCLLLLVLVSICSAYFLFLWVEGGARTSPDQARMPVRSHMKTTETAAEFQVRMGAGWGECFRRILDADECPGPGTLTSVLGTRKGFCERT
jgi:hypothetical protein